MKRVELVRVPKGVIAAGSWKVETGKGGKMSRSSFPLSKRSAIQLGRQWHWRVDHLSGGGHTFRLLTAFQPEKEEYKAVLGVVSGELLTVIAELEFHGTHPGWHYHAASGPLSEITPGTIDHTSRDCVRIPRSDRPHRCMDFGVTEQDALSIAFKFFNITAAKATGDLI